MNEVGSRYQGWDEGRWERPGKAYFESLVLSVGGGALCGWLTRDGAAWYAQKIALPVHIPANTVFAVVQMILYLFMGIGAARIYMKPDSEMRAYALKTYFWQLVFCWLWSVWLFWFRWDIFAFVWLLMLLVQVAWMIAAFRELDPLAARLQIPYLICLSVVICLDLIGLLL